jgi:RNA polymerase sigma-70 factor (ECF subfamily)
MVLEHTEFTTERELIGRCQSADSDAFRILFDRYKDRVYSIALRYSGDDATAQDIAQDTFLKLFSSIQSFRGDAGFESWLYRLVVNACFDHKRKSKRLAPLIEGFLDLVHAPGASALDEVLQTESASQVQRVIDSLPPEQRMLVVLRYTEGLSYDRIAEILDCPAGTVASRLNRIHKVLERRFSRLAARGEKLHV